MHKNKELLRHISNVYRRTFHIDEIEHSPILQWSFGAILFFFFLTFELWDNSSAITVETARRGAALCWPYFQNCEKLYFLHALPNGYSESTLYMAFYGVMLLIVYYMWRKEWVFAHALMLPLFVWKVFVGFVLSYTIMGPYDYYHIIFAVVLLFLPLKEYFLKFSFVFCYFLSATIKFDPGWELGTYFTTLKNGAPLVPLILTPLATNIVIFMQVVGSWFLLSRHIILQRLAFAFFVFFHLYSGILVLYHYPSVTLPLLIILFGPMYKYQVPPRSRASVASWIFMALLVIWQLAPYAIEGDRRLTLEGNRIGMFMFEANHECRAIVTTFEKEKVGTTGVQESTSTSPLGSTCSGTMCLVATHIYKQNDLKVTEQQYESGSAWNRCDPYEFWSRNNERCAINANIQKVSLIFDHSINGGPFYRIVDIDNVCGVTYKAFGHNDWISLPPKAQIVGYPLEDGYRY
jgi:hypothetical protein